MLHRPAGDPCCLGSGEAAGSYKQKSCLGLEACLPEALLNAVAESKSMMWLPQMRAAGWEESADGPVE